MMRDLQADFPKTDPLTEQYYVVREFNETTILVCGITYEYDHGGNLTRMTYIPASLVLQNETIADMISSNSFTYNWAGKPADYAVQCI